MFTTIETFSDVFLSWFPFYYEIKILFVLWILSPTTNGSSVLYEKLINPMLVSKEKEIDDLIENTKQNGYQTFLKLFSASFQHLSKIIGELFIIKDQYLNNQQKQIETESKVNENKSKKLENQQEFIPHKDK